MSNNHYEDPYPGPRPFGSEMRGTFYGRDKELSELFSQIISHQVALLYAQSGAGKTSLLQAGLRPRLIDEGFEVLPIVRVGGYIPKDIDISKLNNIFTLNSLLSLSEGNVELQSLVSLTIVDFLKEREHLADKDNFPKPRVLVFDQFEELFTWYPEYWSKREGFFTDIANALNDDDLLRVLFILREDFIANLHPYTEIIPGHFKTQYHLERLSPEAACKAIEDPLLGRNLSFDKGIADELINELRKIQITNPIDETSSLPDYYLEPYIEPVQIQVVCKKLWDNLHNKVNLITHNHLTTIGNVDTALGDYYEDALRDTVQKTGINENQIRQWFETELITAEGTRGTVFQGKTHTGTLPNEAIEILENKHYIVRAEMRASAHWYELTHDRFIKPIQLTNEKWRDKFLRAERNRHRRKYVFITATLFCLSLFLAISLAKIFRGEYLRTKGQIDALRKIPESSERNSQAETIFDNIANYLWNKGGNKSIDKLISILKKNEDLIPENYRTTSYPASYSLLVDEQTNWPLILEYNPERKFDLNQLELEWYSMASSIASNWGIPAPMRIKTIKNSNLSVNKFRIMAPAYEPFDSTTIFKVTDRTLGQLSSMDVPSKVLESLKEFKDENLEFPNRNDLFEKLKANNNIYITQSTISLILNHIESYQVYELDFQPYPGYRLVSKTNFINDRQKKIFNDLQPAMDSVRYLKFGGPWFFTPKWTLPLLKAAGINPSPSEGAIAVALANKLVNEPQFLLTPQSVSYIINRERKNSPQTVSEALSSRGGIYGIRRDLIKIVRLDFPLIRLQYILDALAKYRDLSSKEIDSLVIDDQNSIKENQNIQLQGNRLQVLQSQNEEDNSKISFSPVYNESSLWLPITEPPVRIYLGSRITSQILTPDGNLAPKILENIDELRGNIYKKFGVIVPAVIFRPNKEGICDSCFRIEVLNQNRENEGALPVPVLPDSAIIKLTENLRVLSTALRTWLITPEYISNLFLYEVEGLYSSSMDYKSLADWLKERYTLTDLKLILRAVILPSDEEVSLYSQYLDQKAIASIPPENTLIDLNWLLGSLVYWLNSGLYQLNLQDISDRLRQTQLARINISPINQVGDNITILIQNGIYALTKRQWNAAASYFHQAVTVDQQQATKTFLALYPHQSKFAPENQLPYVEKICTQLKPGEVADANIMGLQDLYDLEIQLASLKKTTNKVQYQNLNLFLINTYVKNQYYRKAETLIDQILHEPMYQPLSSDEEYLLAYYILSIHEDEIPKPKLLKEADSLLLKVFKNMPETKADSAFSELLKIGNEKYSEMSWFWNCMDSLASLQPNSIWIPLKLSTQYCMVSENYDDTHRGIKLLDKAESNISQISQKDQARIMAWIDWYRANACLKIARYRKSDREPARKNSLLLLNKLRSMIPQDEDGWPRLEDVYSNLESIYMTTNERDQAIQVVNEGLRKFPNNQSLLYSKFFLELASGKILNSLELANQAVKHAAKEDKAPSLFILSIAQILTEDPKYESTTSIFLQTNHEYCDYIRMMLYAVQLEKGNTQQAQKLLQERWMQINPSTWPERLQKGDIKVWREMLISYYFGKVDRETIFGPLSNTKTFEMHPFSKLNMPLSGLLCEGYFYDAILQGVKGESTTRNKRQIELFKKVLATEHYDYYEYHMANYLLNKLKTE